MIRYTSGLFSYLLLLVVCAANSFGQTTTATKASGFVYESEKNGFKVTFPGRPREQTTERDSSFGKTPMTSVSFANMLAEYAVTIIEFPTIMDDKADLDLRFDAARDINSKKPGYSTTKDVQLNFGSYYGRDNTYESATVSLNTRIIAAGPRLYFLVIGTKGRLSTQSEKLRLANQRLIDNFYNSFQITKVATASTEPVELPRDFGVAISGQSLSSSFFGVSLSVPPGWNSISQDQMEILMEMGKEEVERDKPKLAHRFTEQNSRPLAMFANSPADETTPSAMMLVFAERSQYPNFLPMAVAKTYQMTYLDKTEKVMIPATTKNVNGIEFAWVETFDSKDKNYSRIHFANIKGVIFEVLFTYSDPADLKKLVESLDTIKYKPSPMER